MLKEDLNYALSLTFYQLFHLNTFGIIQESTSPIVNDSEENLQDDNQIQLVEMTGVDSGLKQAHITKVNILVVLKRFNILPTEMTQWR